MRTFVVEAVLGAGVEEVFAVCWADGAFKTRLHRRHSARDVDVSSWFPQGAEFRRVCFYTLEYGEGGTRCLETQRYQRDGRGYVIRCAVVPEAAAGQALRIECEWTLRPAADAACTEVAVRGEVECGGGRVWGAATLVESALLAPARDAAQRLLDAARDALAARAHASAALAERASPGEGRARELRWSDFRAAPPGPAPLLGGSLAAAVAAASAPPLVTACSPPSLCPAALPALLRLTGAAPRDATGRTALHAVAAACPPALEPLRLAALRALLAANADVAAEDHQVRRAGRAPSRRRRATPPCTAPPSPRRRWWSPRCWRAARPPRRGTRPALRPCSSRRRSRPARHRPSRSKRYGAAARATKMYTIAPLLT